LGAYLPEPGHAVAVTPEGIFKLHPKIRWAALSSEEGTIVFSQMRPGVASLTSDEDDRNFMELGPLFMTELAGRLTPSHKAGMVESVIVNLQMDSVLLMKVRQGYLAVSTEAAEAYDVFNKIAPQIRERYG
jgi:hypothetical protein